MRIRTVKPDFWAHPIYGRLDPETKWIAIALLNYADDEGYFYADPALVRSAIAPFHENFMKLHESLEKLRAVGWYDQCEHHEMGMIGRIAKWSKHQCVQHPKSSKIKDYWIHEIFMKSSCGTHEVLMPDQGTGNREQGTGNAQGAGVSVEKPEQVERAKRQNKPKHHKHGEYQHVLLTDEEHSKLESEFGSAIAAEAIKVVDEYCETSGKRYQNYNLAIRKWGIERAKKSPVDGEYRNFPQPDGTIKREFVRFG